MASVSCSDFTSTHPVQNEHEVYDLMKSLKKSEVPVVPTKKHVQRPSFVHKRDKITKLLVKKGVIVETSFLFISPLYYAVRVGDIKLVKMMLIFKGADVNSSRRKGTSPLHVAAWRGHHKIFKLLIQNRARVDSAFTRPIKNGFTPLHLACLNNKVKCVKVLLKYGASVTPKCENIYHPIHITVFNNYVEVTKLLLDNSADVNLRFNNEFFNKKWKNTSFWKDMDLTLLLCSIARKYTDMTKLLLKCGADIHLKTKKDKTSLIYAVQASDPELVESFLAKGANPNDRDLYGEPVLFYLIFNANMHPTSYNKEELDLKDEKIKILQLLIDAGG
ncbi:putative ankyrin repeat protein RF_0381 [Microplitis mediator]|uniref:putative ankyrin repeat protein RF_0381 n=1 Tax=Microplitis mediator TaxID=375433 RepID=UPI002552EC59|nr:putative ankyrin repeat protein RF_0381 [Microplitis mediator]